MIGPYKYMFDKEMNTSEFFIWIIKTSRIFASNMINLNQKPITLREWITLFLLWSEYEDNKV